MTPSQAISGNKIRGEIVTHLNVSKGGTDYFNNIKRALNLNNGSINYHLRVLEEKGIVASEMCGSRKWYRLKDPALIASPSGDVYREIISIVMQHEEGIRFKDIGMNIDARGNLTKRVSDLVRDGKIFYDTHTKLYYPVRKQASG